MTDYYRAGHPQPARTRLRRLAERWQRAAEREVDHVKRGIAECAYEECLRRLARLP